MAVICSDIWLEVIKWLNSSGWGQLARTNRALSALVKRHRLGCKRCGNWLQKFDMMSGGSDPTGIIWIVNSGSIFNDDCGLFYCKCGAIHDFCYKCRKPSLFISHAGCADCMPCDELAFGTGIAEETVKITIDGDDAQITRRNPLCDSALHTPAEIKSKDAEPPMDKEDSDADSKPDNGLDNGSDNESDSDLDSYEKFYVGDLGRKYAIQKEKIGDTIYHFSLTGPDGGFGVYWYCKECDYKYSTSDK